MREITIRIHPYSKEFEGYNLSVSIESYTFTVDRMEEAALIARHIVSTHPEDVCFSVTELTYKKK